MRQVTRADLREQSATARHVEQAQRYLDAEPGADLDEAQRSGLIWDLLNGQVTDDARAAVIGLLNASDAGALERLFWDGQLADRLESAIPVGHEQRARLDEFTAERFEAGPGRRVARNRRSVVVRTPVRTRAFHPGMISPSLAAPPRAAT